MRSLRYGLVLEVRKDAIREESGDTVVTDPELERQVRDRFGREPERIYLTQKDKERRMAGPRYSPDTVQGTFVSKEDAGKLNQDFAAKKE